MQQSGGLLLAASWMAATHLFLPKAEMQTNPSHSANKKVPFVYQTKGTFLRDAFLTECDAHYVRDAGFARDARLRRAGRTHHITDHSAAASLITYLQTFLICDIM